jgi:REP element-mobilizing transposase RayT
MPRAGRTFEEGRIYHVYNRVGGGWMAFDDEGLGERFIEIFRHVVDRDEATSFGWCLLENHYHLILRQGPVSLSRSLKTLQQGVTRTKNLRARTFGPLWQGRFKAKEVSGERYLMQLVAYVHLNPVKAGLVETPDQYRWSGHRDIIGRRRNPIVAVDDVLLMYGQTRRRALRRYRAALSAVGNEDWSSRGPGALPWWSLGRPTEEERERLRSRKPAQLDELGRSTARWRPRYGALDWLNLACEHLDVDIEALAGKGRAPENVKMRELIGMVGVERFGVKVTELADVLGKSRDGVSCWMRRGVERRAVDPSFAEAAKRLEYVASEEP